MTLYGKETNLFDFILSDQAATPTSHCNTESDIRCENITD